MIRKTTKTRDRFPTAEVVAKLIRRYHVNDAAEHDSQAVEALMIRGNTAFGVWVDAACRSDDIEAKLGARDLAGHVHRKGKRNKPLSARAKQGNRAGSTVRGGHVFGAQADDIG